MLDLRRVLRNLGASSTLLSKNDAQCARVLGKRKKPRALRARSLEALRALVKELAARLPRLGEDARFDLAFELVTLDSSCADAHRALGRKLVRGVDGREDWLDEEQQKRRARIDELRAAVRKVTAREPEVEVREVEEPVHQTLDRGASVELRHGKIRFVSPLPETRSRTIFRNALRTAALMEFLISGKLEVHRAREGYRSVLVDNRADYESSIDRAQIDGGIDAARATHAKSWSCYHDKRGYTLQRLYSDIFASALLCYHYSYSRDMAPFFRAGLCTWACEAVLGRPMPDVVVQRRERVGATGVSRERRTGEIDPVTYRDAGTYGRRKWLEWLVATGAAPSIVECFEVEIGKIRGKELAK